MISFAQNQEDVVLHRLVDVIPNGCYVDVGAGHPVLENVTYDLYLSGWRGLNIEPMSREVALLREERPEDVTIQTAVGDRAGTLTLYEAPLTSRGSTTARVDIVERYRAQGEEFPPFTVPVSTLSLLIEEHVSGDVHVLKVDVEGMEAEVLAGADLPRWRPWVLVLEATLPNSQVASDAGWASIVRSAGYRETLFDGLNRFYVRDDLGTIADLLSTPANVFDRWESSQVTQLAEAARQASEYATSLLGELDERDRYIRSLLKELDLTRERASKAETYADSLRAELDLRN